MTGKAVALSTSTYYTCYRELAPLEVAESHSGRCGKSLARSGSSRGRVRERAKKKLQYFITGLQASSDNDLVVA